MPQVALMLRVVRRIEASRRFNGDGCCVCCASSRWLLTMRINPSAAAAHSIYPACRLTRHLRFFPATIRPVTPAALRQLVSRLPSLPFVPAPTPVEPLPRLLQALGGGPRLFIQRDDAIPFGFGGNKVRKLALVAARAVEDGADTLITAGGVQSNHARATAAAAAKLGMRAVLVANGSAPDRLTANALLDQLLGAQVIYVTSREARTPKMLEIAGRLENEGRRPFVIPIGASTPLGALGFALAMAELADQMPPPDVLVHSTSSGGTQAGLV